MSPPRTIPVRQTRQRRARRRFAPHHDWLFAVIGVALYAAPVGVLIWMFVAG